MGQGSRVDEFLSRSFQQDEQKMSLGTCWEKGRRVLEDIKVRVFGQ